MEYRIGTRVKCNKYNKFGLIDSFMVGYYTVAYEDKTYGRYTPSTMAKRFELVKTEMPKNVTVVDFINKKVI